jgi:hypothetical protein
MLQWELKDDDDNTSSHVIAQSLVPHQRHGFNPRVIIVALEEV